MRKREIKDADEASAGSESDNLDFLGAQVSTRETKITGWGEERGRSRRFSRNQEESYATRGNIMTEPAITGLNTPKITDS